MTVNPYLFQSKTNNQKLNVNQSNPLNFNKLMRVLMRFSLEKLCAYVGTV